MSTPQPFVLPADLPAALSDETRTLAERFSASLDAAGLPPAVSPACISAFAVSPFVAENAIRRPREFLALITDAQAPRSAADYTRSIDLALAAATDVDSAKTALRRVRQMEMTRIAWRDIALGTGVHVIMAELSAFADAVIAGAMRWCESHLEARFGRAFAANGDALELVVIGMGKLGGGELNFSSDIDLIFVFGEGGTTRGGRRELEHQDYFDRLGREFIALLNDTTGDGQVFRVDMRLRPFGDSGPLTSSLGALEQYYAAHGRDWERYALIKARAITGDASTRAALDQISRAFVYRRYLDYGALDALREMKQLIDREAQSSDLAGNVKRGPGGIREIEFTGQLFQLTRGGREPRLRERSLVTTLNVCAQCGWLERAEVDTLLAAYAYLRMTEHRLQQVHDWQTHSLPESAEEQARLAYAMHEPCWADFLATLDRHRNGVRALFVELLESPAAPAATADAPSIWQTLWQCPADAAVLTANAADAGLELGEAARDVLLGLKSERFLQRLSRNGRERLDRLMPLLLERLFGQPFTEATFRRTSDLLHAIARRSVYLAFLADNPDAIVRLLTLFNASPWIAQEIVAQPLLLDELLDPRVLYQPPDSDRLHELAVQHVRLEDGLEQAMEQLRAFRNQQVLRVAASDVTGHLPVADVSNQLSWIAEACIERALALAWADLARRFGEPHCRDDNGERAAGFAIVAYGKLGGYELGYGSDLDLVFLHDSSGEAQHTDGDKSIENEVFFTRLVQRFIHILATTTASGSAYEVDTRLRPSGSAGMLVCPVSAYRDYLDRDAWVWEHQALVRARAAAGSPAVLARFAEVREAVLSGPRDMLELKNEIVAMRERMLAERDRSDDTCFDLKHGVGGITDIEFMVQYAVLAGAAEHPQLLAWTDNLRLLETIAALALLPADACRQLHDAYFAYRAAIHRSALQQVEATVAAPDFEQHRMKVQKIWDSVFRNS